MNIIRFLLLMVGVFLHDMSIATTWGEKKVDDPINPKYKCNVGEPMSYGNYIYNWPGKYDQVFWPFTEENGIWFCNKTGFTAFIGDFEKITSDEKEKIAAYLKQNYKREESIEEKLELLEGIYALRKTDADFQNRLLRILARWYQNLENDTKANEYREKALSQIKLSLKGDMSEEQRLEYLYLASNYSMQLDNKEASEQFSKDLQDAIAQLKDKNLKGYAEYLQELIKEIPNIEPGGKLDPLSLTVK